MTTAWASPHAAKPRCRCSASESQRGSDLAGDEPAHDRYDYRALEGPDAGVTGTLDYDADYTQWVPFVGIAWERGNDRWRYQPHVQFAMPLPRRGMVGHITGPGFDLSGDQETNGHGAHFGDPSLTIGFDVTYDRGTSASTSAPRSHSTCWSRRSTRVCPRTWC